MLKLPDPKKKEKKREPRSYEPNRGLKMKIMNLTVDWENLL